MHMNAMIRRSCEDLQRTLELLYHEYLDFEAANGESMMGEAVHINGGEPDSGQPHESAAGTKQTISSTDENNDLQRTLEILYEESLGFEGSQGEPGKVGTIHNERERERSSSPSSA